MRIRWKLLIVLLSISLVPILVLRVNGQRGLQKMGNDLAAIAREVLIRKAGLELTLLVEEHASVLRLERELIEMTLRVQASELEKRLAGAHHPYTFRNGSDTATAAPAHSNGEKSALRFRIAAMGRFMPLDVDYSTLNHKIAEGMIIDNQDIPSVFSSMVPVFHDLVLNHPDLIYWQLVALEDGTESVYPALSKIPMSYNAVRTEWYRSAVTQKRVVWSQPSPDPFTRQFSFTVSMPLYSPEGQILGATAISVPVSALLQDDEHFRLFSKNIRLFLVRAESSTDTDTPTIRVIAREHKVEQRHHHWWALTDVESLQLDDPEIERKMALDLQARRTGVVETKYDDMESLLVYGSIDEFGTTLLLIVPRADFIAEAVAMEKTVHESVGTNIQITGIILSAMIALVIVLAFVLAKSMTMNIQKLAAVARKVAEGDFNTRAEIRSHDEMGELGRTFDQMVPALEERVRMKQALDVAMQVQQNLLPRKLPQPDGLEVAGRSIYCDETGGDFFDFMDFCCREDSTLGVAVGDVSGHGISAALLMSTTRAFLRSRVNQPGGLGDIVNDVNVLLSKDTGSSGEFVTLFYTEIDRSRGEIRWARAGHDPALLYDPQSDRFDELQGEGLAMGIDPFFHYAENVKNGLAEGQIIVIGTDGIWETRNDSGEMFGKNRLKGLIRLTCQRSADQIATAVIDELEAFRAGTKQADDVTLVVIKINGTDGPERLPS